MAHRKSMKTLRRRLAIERSILFTLKYLLNAEIVEDWLHSQIDKHSKKYKKAKKLINKQKNYYALWMNERSKNG